MPMKTQCSTVQPAELPACIHQTNRTRRYPLLQRVDNNPGGVARSTSATEKGENVVKEPPGRSFRNQGQSHACSRSSEGLIRENYETACLCRAAYAFQFHCAWEMLWTVLTKLDRL
ncbi:hypothetical protein RSAG8_12433, partial [Rhizoctonia solani AG-8 WAC10335]